MRAVMFGSRFCGHCRPAWKLIEPLQDEGFDVQYIDAFKKPFLAERYKVTSTPTTVILDGNKRVTSFTGDPDPDEIRRLLKG